MDFLVNLLRDDSRPIGNPWIALFSTRWLRFYVLLEIIQLTTAAIFLLAADSCKKWPLS